MTIPNKKQWIIIFFAWFAGAFSLSAQTQKPDDPEQDVLAAQKALRAGKEKEAVQIWDRVIETHPTDERVVELVAGTMGQERLLDRAVQVYLKARRRMGKPDLFCLNLATLYEMELEYGKAAQELIEHVKIHPSRRTVVESRLLQYPAAEKTVGEVVRVLKKAVESESNTLELQKLLVRYATRFGLYQVALETVISMEKTVSEKQKGEALFRFAQDAYLAGGIEPAKKAYQHILQNDLRFDRKDGVLFGLAQCHKNLGLFQEAVSNLDELIFKFPKSGFIPNALLEKGLLERDHLFLPAQSAETLGRLISTFPSSPQSVEALLELAECYFLINDFSRAEAVYERILQRDSAYNRKVRIRAHIRMAWLDYFLGRFEKAQARLDLLFQGHLEAEEIEDPSVNDGLRLDLLLKTFAKENHASLLILAKGELLSKQRRHDEVVDLFNQSIFSKTTADPIVAEALFQKGIALIAMNRYQESEVCFDTLLARFPGYMYSERAMERLGWAQRKSGKHKEALKTYEALLERFPRSVIANDVRKCIREMETENR